MPILTSCFYANASLADILVRIGTREYGECFGDVPAHVGVGIEEDDVYYEAVSSGIRKGTLKTALAQPDLMRNRLRVLVTPAQAQAAKDFAESRIGGLYDWGDIRLDVLAWLSPALSRVWHRKWGTPSDRICSLFAKDFLGAAGIYLPTYDHPETPEEVRRDFGQWISDRLPVVIASAISTSTQN